MFRYLIGIPVSIGITLSLFFLMRFLVTQDWEEPDEKVAATKIEIAREERDENINVEDLSEKPERDEPPPPPPMIQQDFKPPKTEAPKININDLTGDMNLNSSFLSEADVQPIVRVPPQYPTSAAQRGTEGWALVEFTVTAEGDVIDPVIIDSFPDGTKIWDRAVKRAVVKWKYRPRYEGGEPVAWRTQTKLTFELEDN